MANEPQIEQPVDWSSVGEQLAAGLLKVWSTSGIQKAIVSAQAESHGAITGTAAQLTQELLITAGGWLDEALDFGLPFVAAVIGPSIANMFGADIDKEAFIRRLAQGGDVGAGQAVAEAFMKAIANAGQQQLQPSREPATKFAGAACAAAMGGTLAALVPQILGRVIPLDWLHFDELAKLPDSVVSVLGVNGLVSRAMSPLIDATCTTPMSWDVHRVYRHTLLTPTLAARQIAGDPSKREKWAEDLRRQGYSDERIDVLIKEQRRTFAPADVRQFVAREWWSKDRGLQHLRDQGFDEDGATDAIRLEGLRRIEAMEDRQATAVVGAYVRGDLTRGEFVSLLNQAVTPAPERALLSAEADLRRAANVRRLSLGTVEAMVKSGVLSFIDYRRAAEREGYPPDDVAALELQLRWEIDKARDLAELRAQQAAERAAAAAAREAERARRLLEVQAERALARRGRESDLEAAAVRGLIPLGRVAEVYAPRYDADTVQILLDDLADRRADYVERQERAEQLRARAALRAIDVAALERAVQEHVLTLDDYRRRLDELGFTPADAELLRATLAARLQARHQAEAERAEAAAAAKVKRIDLGRFETLVRRGHRTLHDYAAVLDGLGFDEPSIVGMVELLQLRIDDDAAAARVRAEAAARLAARGLSLDQARRAVVLGLMTPNDYAAWLLAQQFTADAANILVAEAQLDADEAAAARTRRAEAERRQQAGKLPLSTLRRAARLGLIPAEPYYARLRAAGYSDDEVALESDLLVAEIAEDRARDAAAEARAASAGDVGLTLAQLAAAVLAGVTPIGDYTARAIGLGLDSDEAATLTATLQAKIDTAAAARARREQLAAANAQRDLTRADVEKAVRDGLRTLDDYEAWLLDAGYDDDDAALLVAELELTIGAGGASGDV